MRTKEMFEKLGYCLIITNDDTITYRKNYNTTAEFIEVVFEKKAKSFYASRTRKIYLEDSSAIEERSIAFINIAMLQAINKQVEELGWLDVKNS